MRSAPAPSGKPVNLNLPPEIAGKLALYAGAYETVLAPRGWSCTGILANDATKLSVSPAGPKAQGNDGSILIGSWGAGSGLPRTLSIAGQYFASLVSVAEITNFIADRGLVDRNNNSLTISQFLAPRFSSDRLTYLSRSALEYATPPDKDGIEGLVFGSDSPFAQTGIISVHLNDGSYGDDTFVANINVNLPPDLAYLTPFILSASTPCMIHEDVASCSMHAHITYAKQ